MLPRNVFIRGREMIVVRLAYRRKLYLWANVYEFIHQTKLVTHVKFDGAFIFKYSPRPHAAASKMTDDASKQTKEERHQRLLTLQDRIIKDKNKLLVGSIQQALGMNQAKRPPQHIKGRTRQNALAIYKGSSDFIGQLSDVKIKCIEGNTLIGERV